MVRVGLSGATTHVTRAPRPGPRGSIHEWSSLRRVHAAACPSHALLGGPSARWLCAWCLSARRLSPALGFVPKCGLGTGVSSRTRTHARISRSGWRRRLRRRPRLPRVRRRVRRRGRRRWRRARRWWTRAHTRPALAPAPAPSALLSDALSQMPSLRGVHAVWALQVVEASFNKRSEASGALLQTFRNELQVSAF